MDTVHFTIQTGYPTLLNTNWKLYNTHWTLDTQNTNWKPYTSQYKLDTILFTIQTGHCTLHHKKLDIVHFTIQTGQWTCTIQTGHCTLQSRNWTLFTPHFKLGTVTEMEKTYVRASNVCVNLFVVLVKSVTNSTLFCRKSELCCNFFLLG